MIYMLEEEGGEYVKIGYSKSNAEARRAACQTGNPRPLRLVWTWRGGPELEKLIHEALTHRRVQGEWFRRDASMDNPKRFMAMINVWDEKRSQNRRNAQITADAETELGIRTAGRYVVASNRPNLDD